MKLYLRAIFLFLLILLLLSGLVWLRFQNLHSKHLDLRLARFKSTCESIVSTYQLVSQTIAEELLLQEDVIELVHAIVTHEGDERNHYRGLLFRKLSPMYNRIRQYSVRQLHFHFPDGRSMLRFHAPHKADDDLTPFRPSVRIANTERREVHGYESGRIVHGFRHVYPLQYRGEVIGSVEISNSFQEIYTELIKHVDGGNNQYHFILLKDDLWYKLSSGQRENYHPSQLSDAYLCENSLAKVYDMLGGSVMMTTEMRELLDHLRADPAVAEGLRAEQDFIVASCFKGKTYSVLFHSVKNVDDKHAAYIINMHPEDYLVALQGNVRMQLIIAVVFAALLTFLQFRLSMSRAAQLSTQKFLQTLTDHMGQGLYATDLTGKITFLNHEAEKLLGLKEKECLGRDAHALFHVPNDTHEEDVCPVLEAILNNRAYEQQENFFRRSDGVRLPVELTSTPIEKQGKIAGTITLFQDISARQQQERELAETQKRLKKANRHLARIAHIDGLTQIANRRLFDQVLQNYWKSACRHQKPLSLLLMDIDHFKAYNDTYGHQKGDECLRAVAEVIQNSCMRPEDFVARYGGEEFVALLSDTGQADASHIAERIRNNLLQQQLEHKGSAVESVVTLSIGVCSLQPKLTDDPQIIVDCSDRCLYLAKEKGRNQTRSTEC
ncbi:PAS domain S-box-containing protein/diguanylate cyclase (GGDEF) domain-containing protein [Malonomonas rubra DSM 5091]|uniref:diguanylate cyclase n=1 Tax=Malonomonas rubra DSM 5091 TaxID=1122189 RepID=A0A1M6EXD9_MALRU|nr:diguanylate cyclase [Malonomonas rubra]SHI90100.1 PAS domain S-box-containing protein/diguanylate cyclase (GGDEF) domain-containing protein [Malonomonas rubra DSM 5091]